MSRAFRIPLFMGILLGFVLLALAAPFAGFPLWAGEALALAGSVGIFLLGLRQDQRRRDLERVVDREIGGRLEIEKNAMQLFSLYKEGRSRQVELAEGILGTIARSADITTLVRRVEARVDSFDEDFHGVGQAVGDLGNLVEHLGNSATRLAAAAEQSAAASEEMAASIEHMSKESGQRYDGVRQLVELSASGRGEMGKNVEAIARVVKAVESLQQSITSIDDIASRTSLLAMNAAIQAAHAGIAGKGFAVVAQEVRKLAIASAENARNIIEGLQSLRTSIDIAREGSEASARLFTSLEEGVGKAADSFLEIRNGSVELATSGQEIRDAVASLKSVSLGLRDAIAQASTTMKGLEGRFAHLTEESSAIDGELGIAGESGSEINFRSLTIAQIEIAALKLSDRMLELTADKEQESFIGLVLKLQHLAWIARVRAAIDGKISVESRLARDHGACDLGRWLDAGGRNSISERDLRQRLDAEHEAMHELAGLLLDHVARRELDQSEALMGELRRRSESIVLLVDRIFENGATRVA